MSKWKAISILCIVIFVLSSIATTASAGVEPSPFKSDANKLLAVENNMNSIAKRLDGILAEPPPDDNMPGLNGEVNRLEAMENELGVLLDKVNAVLGESPPDDSRVVTATATVSDSGQGLVDKIERYVPPDSCPPEFVIALDSVNEAAQAIVDLTDEFLDGR